QASLDARHPRSEGLAVSDASPGRGALRGGRWEAAGRAGLPPRLPAPRPTGARPGGTTPGTVCQRRARPRAGGARRVVGEGGSHEKALAEDGAAHRLSDSPGGGGKVKALSKQLESGDPKARRHASRELRDTGGPAGPPYRP